VFVADLEGCYGAEDDPCTGFGGDSGSEVEVSRQEEVEFGTLDCKLGGNSGGTVGK
jgi:hypothetical protein